MARWVRPEASKEGRMIDIARTVAMAQALYDADECCDECRVAAFHDALGTLALGPATDPRFAAVFTLLQAMHGERTIVQVWKPITRATKATATNERVSNDDQTITA
jgi:hypothetical protein